MAEVSKPVPISMADLYRLSQSKWSSMDEQSPIKFKTQGSGFFTSAAEARIDGATNKLSIKVRKAFHFFFSEPLSFTFNPSSDSQYDSLCHVVTVNYAPVKYLKEEILTLPRGLIFIKDTISEDRVQELFRCLLNDSSVEKINSGMNAQLVSCLVGMIALYPASIGGMADVLLDSDKQKLTLLMEILINQIDTIPMDKSLRDEIKKQKSHQVTLLLQVCSGEHLDVKLQTDHSMNIVKQLLVKSWLDQSEVKNQDEVDIKFDVVNPSDHTLTEHSETIQVVPLKTASEETLLNYWKECSKERYELEIIDCICTQLSLFQSAVGVDSVKNDLLEARRCFFTNKLFEHFESLDGAVKNRVIADLQHSSLVMFVKVAEGSDSKVLDLIISGIKLFDASKRLRVVLKTKSNKIIDDVFPSFYSSDLEKASEVFQQVSLEEWNQLLDANLLPKIINLAKNHIQTRCIAPVVQTIFTELSEQQKSELVEALNSEDSTDLDDAVKVVFPDEQQESGASKACYVLSECLCGLDEGGIIELLPKFEGPLLVICLIYMNKQLAVEYSEVYSKLSCHQFQSLINDEKLHFFLINLEQNEHLLDDPIVQASIAEGIAISNPTLAMTLLDLNGHDFGDLAATVFVTKPPDIEPDRSHALGVKLEMLKTPRFGRLSFDSIKLEPFNPAYIECLKLLCASGECLQNIVGLIFTFKLFEEQLDFLNIVTAGNDLLLVELSKMGTPKAINLLFHYFQLEDESEGLELLQGALSFYLVAFNSIAIEDYLIQRTLFLKEIIEVIVIRQDKSSSLAQRMFLRTKLSDLLAIRDMGPESRIKPRDLHSGVVKLGVLANHLFQLRGQREEGIGKILSALQASTRDLIDQGVNEVFSKKDAKGKQLSEATVTSKRRIFRKKERELTLREKLELDNRRAEESGEKFATKKSETNAYREACFNQAFAIEDVSEDYLDSELKIQEESLAKTTLKLEKCKEDLKRLQVEAPEVSDENLSGLFAKYVEGVPQNERLLRTSKIQMCSRHITEKIGKFNRGLDNIREEMAKVDSKRHDLKLAREELAWSFDELLCEISKKVDILLMEQLTGLYNHLCHNFGTVEVPKAIGSMMPQLRTASKPKAKKGSERKETEGDRQGSVIAQPSFLYSPKAIIQVVQPEINKGVQGQIAEIKAQNAALGGAKVIKEINPTTIQREREQAVIDILFEVILRSNLNITESINRLCQFPNILNASDKQRKTILETLVPRLLTNSLIDIPYRHRKIIAECELKLPIFNCEEYSIEEFKFALTQCLSPINKDVLVSVAQQNPETIVRLVTAIVLQQCSERERLAIKDVIIELIRSGHFNTCLIDLGSDLGDGFKLFCRSSFIGVEVITSSRSTAIQNSGNELVDFSSTIRTPVNMGDPNTQLLLLLSSLDSLSEKGEFDVSSDGSTVTLPQVISALMLKVIPEYQKGRLYCHAIVTDQLYFGGRVLFDSEKYKPTTRNGWYLNVLSG